MNTLVDRLGCYPLEGGDSLDVLRVPLDLPTIPQEDKMLRSVIGGAALISSCYEGDWHFSESYVSRRQGDQQRDLIVAGSHNILETNGTVRGFVVRHIDPKHKQVLLPELSVDPTDPMDPRTRIALGHALLDGITQDLPEDMDAFEVRLSMRRPTSTGQRLLIGQRGFMRSNGSAMFATNVGRLRRRHNSQQKLEGCIHFAMAESSGN